MSTLIEKYGNVELEKKLLSSIIKYPEKFTELNLLSKIKPGYFTNFIYNQMFELIQNYHLKYSGTFTIEVLNSELLKTPLESSESLEKRLEIFKTIYDELINLPDEPLSAKYIIDKLRAFYITRSLVKGFNQCLSIIEKKPNEPEIASDFMFSKLYGLVRENEDLIDREEYIEGIGKRLKVMEDHKRNPEKYAGLPTGFSNLDTHVVVRKGNLALVFGETSIGKSWFLQRMALSAFRNNKKVLVISTEMTKESWERRLDSQISHISYDTLWSGDLDEREMEMYLKRMHETKKRHHEKGGRIYVYYISSSTTLSFIKRELMHFSSIDSPIDLLVVDYPDMLALEKDYNYQHEALSDLFKEMKSLAGEFNIVVWATTQRTRTRYGSYEIALNEVAYSGGKVHPSDIVLGIAKTAELDFLKLSVLKNREGRVGMSIMFRVDFSIGEIEEIGIV